MSNADIRVGDIGTIFRLTIVDKVDDPVNISAATLMEVRFGKPGGVSVDLPAAFETDGVDGVIVYTAVSGDLDLSGRWRIQAHIVSPAGEWRSEIETFQVAENLDAP